MDKIAGLIMGYRAAKALYLAVEVGLFDALDAAKGNPAAVARRVGVSLRGTSILLEILEALGFLTKKGKRYMHTPVSRRRLCIGGPESAANNLRYQEFLSQAYADLLTTVRRGRPRQDLTSLLSRRPAFVRDYIRGMADISRRPARELAAWLDLSLVENMLDMGGGPGVYSLACIEKKPELKATILDLPETLRHTRKFVKAERRGGHVFFKAGDYHKTPLEPKSYDLILMSHITHDEGPKENAMLIKRAYAALRPGGQVVIHDFMLESGQREPLFAALFSIHLLSYTRSGRTYAESDYREWLAAAGFARPIKRFIAAQSPTPTVALAARK
ncbi:MAG: methyltransferase [Elusimicrobiota bacterium]